MLIPRISSEMISNQPDQVSRILNEVIDEVNKLKENK